MSQGFRHHGQNKRRTALAAARQPIASRGFRSDLPGLAKN